MPCVSGVATSGNPGAVWLTRQWPMEPGVPGCHQLHRKCFQRMTGFFCLHSDFNICLASLVYRMFPQVAHLIYGEEQVVTDVHMRAQGRIASPVLGIPYICGDSKPGSIAFKDF